MPQLRSSFAILVGAAALIAMVWAIALERIGHEREEAIAGAARQNANLALAFEEHIRRTIAGLDRVVRFLRHEYIEEKGRPNLRYLLDESSLDGDAITAAAVIDAKGDVVVSIRNNEGRNVADRDYFAHHRAMPVDELRIGPAVTGRFTGRTTIHLTRPVLGADGAFAGVVLVGVDPEQFARFYRDVELGARGLIVLAGLDGHVRARRAGPAFAAGNDLAGSPLFRQLGRAPTGTYLGGEAFDGGRRYISYRQLWDYPLVVAVGTSEPDILAGADARARNYRIGATLGTLLVLAFSGMMLIGMRREREQRDERSRAAEALRESEARFRMLTTVSSDFYWETDAEHRLTARGGRPSPVAVFARNEQIGKRRWELPSLTPDEEGWRRHRGTLERRLPFRGFEISRRAMGGGENFISLSGDPVFDANGAFRGYRGVGVDITERKRAERARLEAAGRAAAQAQAIAELAGSQVLADGDVEGVARLATEVAARATGVARANTWLFNEDETELRCIDLFEARDGRHSAGALLTEQQFANEFQALKSAPYVNADDPFTDPRTAGYVESYVKPLGITSMLDAVVQLAGKHLGLLCLEHVGPSHRWTDDEIAFARQLADKIALAITNGERRRAEARYRATYEQSATGIVHASLEGMILSANGKFCRMLGYEEAELLGRCVDEITHPEDRHTTLAAARELALQADDSLVPEYEKRYLRKDGAPVWVSLSVCVVRDARRIPEYFIGLASDISSRKKAEAELARRAHYDPLTELPNRVLCFDRLTQAIAQAGRKRWTTGVLFMDLDRFKAVNETLGHGAGDAVLRLAAQRLQACVRPGDTVARVGGDEFTVVMAELASAQDGAVVAQKILDAMAEPLRVEGQEVYITTSIGIATFPGDGIDPQTLVSNGAAAMLRAKEIGRNNYQFYAAAMNERALEVLQLETDLRRALERGEFFLNFQPKVSLKSGRVTGMEALLRWNRPGHGPVSPAQFVPVLEDTGLIVPVGDWIIDAACAQLREWMEQGFSPAPVAVNLAAKQFIHRDIGGVIAEALARHAVPGRLLQVEITESDAMASPEQVSATLGGLRALGVSVALDDFGTGYSSLGYLKRFPLDTLKLDRSFVTGLPGDPDDVSIALAVIGMAHSLGLKVVAEGVEKPEQRDFLAAQGCDEMQGYLFARPVLAAEGGAFLERAVSERTGASAPINVSLTLERNTQLPR